MMANNLSFSTWVSDGKYNANDGKCNVNKTKYEKFLGY